MQEVFEKIIEKLNSKKAYFQRFYECEGKSEHDADLNKSTQLAFDDAIEIVKQTAAEYNNGWIPCSVELPPQPEENPMFENKPLKLYLVSVEGEKYSFRAFWNGKIFTDGFSKVEPMAWQPLPLPFRDKE